MRTRLKPWKRISTRIAYKNPYMLVEEDSVLLPNGKKGKYFLSNRNRSAVTILAFNSAGKILVQREFRYPVGAVIHCFPGGLVELGEKLLPASKREFQEETGYQARSWESLGSFYASPSRTNLKFFVYIAKEVTFVGDSPDEAEFLEHEWVSLRKLRTMVKNGTISVQTDLACLLLFSQKFRF
jgi:ADP-ribose pyrophosphatase